MQKSTFGMAANEVGRILNIIGATASDVAGMLNNTSGWSVSQVGGFLRNTLHLSQDAAATALGYARFAASTISDWAGTAWDTIKSGVCGIFGC